LGWARTAKSDRERDIFVEMANTWLAAAVRASERERAGISISPYDPIEAEVTVTCLPADPAK